MKRIVRSSLLMMFVVLLAGTPVMAMTIGFQPSAQTVNLGSSLAVDVVATLGSNEIVSAYDLDLGYNPLILNATGVTFGTFLGAPLSIFSSNLSAGLVDFAEVSFLNDSDLAALQPSAFTLATISFTAIGLGTSSLDIVNYLNGVNDIKGLNNTIYLSPVLDQGSVTVTASGVPIPGAVWLLGSGLMGLLGLKRKFLG
jgi:hypothetical protein